jgi:hypothetical protein
VCASPIITTIRPGDTTKTNPFTVVIVSNPALEAPWKSGNFVIDPITSMQVAFNAAVGRSRSAAPTVATSWFDLPISRLLMQSSTRLRGGFLKSPKSHLEEVSTVRGSGWVADQHTNLRLILNMIASPIRYRGRY